VSLIRSLPVLLLAALASPPTFAADAGSFSFSGPWPKTYAEGGRTLSLYCPDPVRFAGGTLELQAALAVEEGGSTTYGIVDLAGYAETAGETVHVTGLRLVRAGFPGAGDPKGLRELVARHLPDRFDVPLDRLTEAVQIAAAVRGPRRVKNDPPAILFRTTPALLVVVDGEAAYRDVPGTALKRVVNTRPLLVVEPGTGRHFLRLLDGWLAAPALLGPYAVVSEPTKELDAVLAWASKEPSVDLLAARAEDHAVERPEPGGKVESPSLAAGAPEIVVSTKPAELVVTDGKPQLEPIANTGVLYWKNTSSDVLVDAPSGQIYLLLAGRWFRAATTDGPFTYVEPKALPPSFASIPPGHPKEAVLASLPSTPQAREAMVANRVPQTATVRRASLSFEPSYDGPPGLEPIEGTGLSYVPNASVPIVRVADGEWYAVKDGVWFTAPSANGPWSVAARVAPAIYSIPPSSPLYYVTYARVYGATPEEVYVGYTPGYYGTVFASGVVVYGTGYWYRPWIGAGWWGPPWTYGYGARVYWSSWGGWGLTACWGWRPYGYWWGYGVGPHWGPWGGYRAAFYPHAFPGYYGYRPAPFGPGFGAGAYGRWGTAAVAATARPATAAAPLSAAKPAAASSAWRSAGNSSGARLGGGKGGAQKAAKASKGQGSHGGQAKGHGHGGKRGGRR